MDGTWRVAPCLGVKSVAAAVDYFVEQLGFARPERLYGPAGEEVYAVTCRDGIEVHLQIRRGGVFPTDRRSDDGDAYFFVPDADALRAEFGSRSVKVVRDLLSEPYGLRDFTIETPDGHRLTFGSELPPGAVPATEPSPGSE